MRVNNYPKGLSCMCINPEYVNSFKLILLEFEGVYFKNKEASRLLLASHNNYSMT